MQSHAVVLSAPAVIWGGMTTDGHAIPTGASPAQLLAEAIALQKAGKLADAEQLLEHITALEPSNFSAWFNRAVGAEQRRDWASAAAMFERAAAIDPARSDVEFRRAIALYHLGDLMAAEAAATSHLKRRPRD